MADAATWKKHVAAWRATAAYCEQAHVVFEYVPRETSAAIGELTMS